MSGFAEHRRAILLAVERRIGSGDWPARIDGNTKRRGIFLGCEEVFQRNNVHDSRMRILCGFYAKEQMFVCIWLEEKFPNAFKIMKIRVHKLGKLSQDNSKR
jgi:hypothetical protein